MKTHRNVISLLSVSLVCLLAAQAWATTTRWNGEGDAVSWGDPANWDNGLPAAGINVEIDGGSANVLLTNATPELASFEISGASLVFSNWFSALNATNVTVNSGGILTMPGSFTDAGPSNRIYVVCSNFTLNTGGSINANARGFAGGTTGNASGPGAGSAYVNAGGGGGGHGGVGGRGSHASNTPGGVSYGFTNAPVEPGSGGARGRQASNNGDGGDGGGAVRIDASGTVTINATISANGSNGSNVRFYGGGGGSGGSIYITCHTFVGDTNGLLRANAGNGGQTNVDGGGGGGGRIAVIADQMERSSVGVRFEAGVGTGLRNSGIGTLYLSNTNLLSETLAHFNQIRVVVPTLTTWSLDQLAVSNRVVALETHDGEGFSVTVQGNVVVTNGGFMTGGLAEQNGVSANLSGTANNPSMTVGGDVLLADGLLLLGVNGTGSPVALEAGGDVKVTGSGARLIAGGQNQTPLTQVQVDGHVTLTNSGALWIYSGATNGVATDYGALLAVTGKLDIASGSVLYPVAHSTDGGAPLLTAASLEVQEGGQINANARGYVGGTGVPAGIGAGSYAGNRAGSGAGHGGVGGNSSNGEVGGIAYGSTNAPIDPGSGGGRGQQASNLYFGGNGGGTVRMVIEGAAVVDGTMTANGGNGLGGAAGYGGGGGAGGAVFIAADTFSGESTGLITANGGDGGERNSGIGGPGGGGRIAVAIGFSEAELADLIAGEEIPGLTSYAVEPAFQGDLFVSPGTVWSGASPGGGSQVYLRIQSETDRAVTITGDPDLYGSPTPDAYGSYLIPDGTILTNVVMTPVNATATQRWASLGWHLYDDQSTLTASGTTQQAAFEVTEDLTLIWRWTNEFPLAFSAGPNGSVNDGALEGWYTNATEVAGVLATPDAGYEFLRWFGPDVPAGQALENPMVVTMDRARTNITAAFSSLAGETKAWNGSGAWTSITNWSSHGMPGPNDIVVIQSGNVTLPFAVAHQAMTVQGGATVTMAGWNTSVTTVNEFSIQNGGVVTLPSAFTTSQMSNRVHIVAGSFTLHEGGSILAGGRGFAGDNGPGRGLVVTHTGGSGGGYGGKGGAGTGNSYVDGGAPYGEDRAAAPEMPGSGGGGARNSTRDGGPGGGVVRLDVSGLATIDGLISANGGSQASSSYYGAGGGSGGSIFIVCGALQGGENAILQANGGDRGALGTMSGGGGGGGRIGVWIGVPESLREQYLTESADRVIVASEYDNFLGDALVEPGMGWKAYPDPDGAHAGTIYFMSMPPQGTIFMIR